jgi:hypothetical protein
MSYYLLALASVMTLAITDAGAQGINDCSACSGILNVGPNTQVSIRRFDYESHLEEYLSRYSLKVDESKNDQEVKISAYNPAMKAFSDLSASNQEFQKRLSEAAMQYKYASRVDAKTYDYLYSNSYDAVLNAYTECISTCAKMQAGPTLQGVLSSGPEVNRREVVVKLGLSNEFMKELEIDKVILHNLDPMKGNELKDASLVRRTPMFGRYRIRDSSTDASILVSFKGHAYTTEFTVKYRPSINQRTRVLVKHIKDTLLLGNIVIPDDALGEQRSNNLRVIVDFLLDVGRDACDRSGQDSWWRWINDNNAPGDGGGSYWQRFGYWWLDDCGLRIRTRDSAYIRCLRITNQRLEYSSQPCTAAPHVDAGAIRNADFVVPVDANPYHVRFDEWFPAGAKNPIQNIEFSLKARAVCIRKGTHGTPTYTHVPARIKNMVVIVQY